MRISKLLNTIPITQTDINTYNELHHDSSFVIMEKLNNKSDTDPES